MCLSVPGHRGTSLTVAAAQQPVAAVLQWAACAGGHIALTVAAAQPVAAVLQRGACAGGHR